jgi:ParB/RepB/Spo0J family partition protein
MTKKIHCPGCEGDLLPKAFNKNASRPNGLQRYCRECQLAQKKDWDDRNRDKKVAYDKARRLAAKAPVVADSASNQIFQDIAEKDGTIRTVALHQVVTEAHAPSAADSIQEATQTGGFAHLPHGAIAPSLTNPRRHFDRDFLVELAASIKEHGIAQPLLVRPLPPSRVEETSWEPLSPQAAYPFPERSRKHIRPTHEIVAGEQRWRASEIAGLRFVPVLIRELTDRQVLELQLVENLKRRDLHPMEEAEGYDRLRETMGLTAEDIAERINKGRTYVYKTMKLLDLVGEAREAFYAGKLTRSTAELVAFRPAHLQAEILKAITVTDFHGEPMSFRAAKALVDERYMLRLGSAVFKITDETLVSEAGSCRTCPKRSGANPDLFDDVAHADTCTDPQCFSGKKEAHYARITADAEARGQTVIVGKAAKEIMPNSTTLRGYTKVDDHQAVDGQMKTLRKVLGKDMPTPTLIEDPQTHAMVEVLPTAVVGQLLKEQGISKAPTVEANDAAAKREISEKYEKAWRRMAIEKIDAALQNDGEGGFNAPVLRQLALMLVDGLSSEARSHTCTLLGLGRIAPREAIEGHIAECPQEEIDRVLLLLLAQHDADRTEGAPRIDALAKEYRVDVAQIKSGVKAAMKKATSEAKVESAAAAIKAQAPVKAKPVRAPKVGKAEAAAAIAQQLQQAANPNAFEVGQRVRLKANLRKGADVINTRDVEADVIERLGDRAWVVQPDNISFTLSADYTEMEVIEP